MADIDNPTNKEVADALRDIDPDPDTLSRSFDVQFTRIRCAFCDMNFYVSDFWQKQRLKDHGTFYCPNGHSMLYRALSKAQEREQ